MLDCGGHCIIEIGRGFLGIGFGGVDAIGLLLA